MIEICRGVGLDPAPLLHFLQSTRFCEPKIPDPSPSVELKVTAYNVNEGHNHEIMEACRTLKNYSIFVSKVRKYKKEAEDDYNSTHSEMLELMVDRRTIMKGLISTAVTKAIDDCIAEGILADFFREHRQEVIDMSITEYLSEELAEVYKEDGFEEGRDTHLIELVTKKLSKGCAPEVIADILEEPLESIQEICDIALKYAPDYDVKKILDEYNKVKNAQPV